MERRELLKAATGLALASAAAAAATAEQTGGHDPEHHHHMGGSPLGDSATHCVHAAQLCLAHCFDLLAKGNTALVACARTVTGLEAVCHALAVLSAQNSPHLAHYAAVAREVCKSCEDECRKHLEHAPCKACAEACAGCAEECAKIAA
jgi:Cys-rich four helix bundle protein (predicted Tat secretion target)